jgi:hypothetical protein
MEMPAALGRNVTDERVVQSLLNREEVQQNQINALREENQVLNQYVLLRDEESDRLLLEERRLKLEVRNLEHENVKLKVKLEQLSGKAQSEEAHQGKRKRSKKRKNSRQELRAEDMMPYPAPMALIQESLELPYEKAWGRKSWGGRPWKLWEEEAVIKHIFANGSVNLDFVSIAKSLEENENKDRHDIEQRTAAAVHTFWYGTKGQGRRILRCGWNCILCAKFALVRTSWGGKSTTDSCDVLQQEGEI